MVRDNPQELDNDLNPNLCLAKVPAAEANQRLLDRGERLERWFDALSAARQTPGAEVIDLTRFRRPADVPGRGRGRQRLRRQQPHDRDLRAHARAVPLPAANDSSR